MIKFSESLIAELEIQLVRIHSESDNPIHYAEEAIKVLIPMLGKLKAFIIKYKFSSKVEEIVFFREIKPKFAAKLIYYNEVYNIVVNKPVTSKKSIKKYYAAELKKLQIYFDENSDFCKYYRTGNRCLDNKYFIRGKQDIRMTLDSFYLQADHRFSTSHDYKVARIVANEKISLFLETEISKLSGSEINKSIADNQPGKPHKWTASKVALTELIYALHAEGVFNNGNSELKEIMAFFESAFSINLGQYHRTFLEIRERKSERTKFLNSLKEKLMIRMDIADEHN